MSCAFSEGLSVNVSLKILSVVVIFSSLRFPIIPNHFLKIITLRITSGPKNSKDRKAKNEDAAK